MKIAAIVVTCNRKKMLSDLLDDLFSQSRRPDGIIVVDNGSEDGTVKFIRERYPEVQLQELKQNSGLYGGLEIGATNAVSQGYDAVWLVDDDARLRKDSLECLMSAVEEREDLQESVIWCSNIVPDGPVFTEPVCVKIDGEWTVFQELIPELADKVYESNGGPNIGIYISSKVIKEAGPPRGDMIFCGEQEFIYRVQKKGFKLFRCFASIVYHKPHLFSEVKFMGRTRFVSKVPPWHTYYEMRNRIFVDMTFNRRSTVRSLLNTAVDAVTKLSKCDKKISTAFYISKAVIDGLTGKTGMRVQIPRPK